MFAFLVASFPLAFPPPTYTRSTSPPLKKIFRRVKCGRCMGLTALSPSMSRLCRQCGILNISQPYRPPQPVMGIGLLLLFYIWLYLRFDPLLRKSHQFQKLIFEAVMKYRKYACLIYNTLRLLFSRVNKIMVNAKLCWRRSSVDYMS
jgi:hypothetical protein